MAKKLKKKTLKTSSVKAKLIKPFAEEKTGGARRERGSLLDFRPAAAGLGEEIKKTKIRVIGIGGGGGNIVSEIASKVS
ncbi:MAG: hypothetical protein Q8M94_17910, partial [Ignavibacteria bacterium]|nr:hypothetical protein [Ignavibacteria bacterium]